MKAALWFIVILACIPCVAIGMLGGAALDWISAQWDWLMEPIKDKKVTP